MLNGLRHTPHKYLNTDMSSAHNSKTCTEENCPNADIPGQLIGPADAMSNHKSLKHAVTDHQRHENQQNAAGKNFDSNKSLFES